LEDLLRASGSDGEAAAPNWIARHPLALESAYGVATGEEPEFTSYHEAFFGTVDYVWYTPQVGADMDRHDAFFGAADCVWYPPRARAEME
jgi:mRNA deadenylase 3'-5' endonuclease subunit Ccr4